MSDRLKIVSSFSGKAFTPNAYPRTMIQLATVLGAATGVSIDGVNWGKEAIAAAMLDNPEFVCRYLSSGSIEVRF